MSEKAIMCGKKLLTIAIDHDLQSKVNFRVPVPVFRKMTPNMCQVALHAVLIVREPNPEFLQKSILPYTVSPLDFLDFFHLSVS